MTQYFKLDPYPYEKIKMLNHNEAVMGGPESPLNIALQRIISRMEYLAGNRSAAVMIRSLRSLPGSYGYYSRLFQDPKDPEKLIYYAIYSNKLYLYRYDLVANTWTGIYANYSLPYFRAYAFLNIPDNQIILTGGSNIQNSKNRVVIDLTNTTIAITGNVNPGLYNVYNGIVCEDKKQQLPVYVFGSYHNSTSARGYYSFKLDRSTGAMTTIKSMPIRNPLTNIYLTGTYLTDREILIPVRQTSNRMVLLKYDTELDTYQQIATYNHLIYGSYAMVWVGNKLYYIDLYFGLFYRVSENLQYLYREANAYYGHSYYRDRIITYIENGDKITLGTSNTYRSETLIAV